MPDFSSNSFDAYAEYYDLLYSEKDYAGEASYVHNLIQRYYPGARTILELGCGIGSHARHFANFGYDVLGVDRSPAMVKQAASRSIPTSGNLVFLTGDLRTARFGKTYDVVLALFHVMSYQVSNTDLQLAMQTAALHLRPGGLFIFDCWYGPGVLTDPPATRVRRLKNEYISITRIAEPLHYPNEDRVDVNYEILVEHSNGTERIREIHSMRYLFAPEVEQLLGNAGMKLIKTKAWMLEQTPTLGTWNACFIAARCA